MNCLKFFLLCVDNLSRKVVYMARIIDTVDGKRKMIKLSTDDIISVIREYQNITYKCYSVSDIRSALSDTVIFIPEDV